MRIIEPYVEVWPFNGKQILRNIEKAGRTCYKSEDRITDDSYVQFIRGIIERGHESVLEHEKVTVKFVVDRGVSHEIVRHRLASYSQESTRYCNYAGDKFGNEITVIRPFWADLNESVLSPGYEWFRACQEAENAYLYLLIKHGWTAQQARSVLPNSLKTEVVMTANLREWRHFFRLRASRAAHPQMRQVAIPLLLYLRERLHPAFNDIPYDEDSPIEHYAEVREG
jgi:thymidylate synthase (FAD)